ncbi:unnamed protein product [Didymodactylos carnosus]|uniref:Uncharacterized protein n=1 Tax=Didymodactylos carnosus TaxID=1234261 RepID=A0A814K5R0_9BILA|nr:unnamed protein product [Didymodactylos carnosus]CAF1149955.1 unnamed protein product [Didymodactylos carnosus]CAF3816413.1 unnamed protein product [Didymodactylos carnosus]CAF3955477.1 unnamed protein product [Didymodactylos carnosus]
MAYGSRHYRNRMNSSSPLSDSTVSKTSLPSLPFRLRSKTKQTNNKKAKKMLAKNQSSTSNVENYPHLFNTNVKNLEKLLQSETTLTAKSWHYEQNPQQHSEEQPIRLTSPVLTSSSFTTAIMIPSTPNSSIQHPRMNDFGRSTDHLYTSSSTVLTAISNTDGHYYRPLQPRNLLTSKVIDPYTAQLSSTPQSTNSLIRPSVFAQRNNYQISSQQSKFHSMNENDSILRTKQPLNTRTHHAINYSQSCRTSNNPVRFYFSDINSLQPTFVRKEHPNEMLIRKAQIRDDTAILY